MIAVPSPRPIGAARSSLLTNLTSYWKLEESTGTRVDQLGAFSLTPTNNPTNAAGIIGNSLSCSGASAQFVKSTTLGLSAVTKFTMAGWFFRASTANLTFMGWDTGSTTFVHQFSDGTVVLAVNGVSATPADGLTSWNHYALVYDASLAGNARGKVYRNGTNMSVSWSGTPGATLTTTGDFRIGGSVAFARYTTGRHDETGFWTGSALSAAQITSLYNAGLAITWPFSGAP